MDLSPLRYELIKNDYVTALSPLKIETANILDSITQKFSLVKDVTQTCKNRGSIHHSRALRVAKEIKRLQKGLPLAWEASIFVRVDENRPDILKALVIGPEDTPYADGCFFFDICLPPEFPDTPPIVRFLTTGGGSVQFNPNLYPNGKVCLSLLGTWDGPGWNSSSSTLLQVLVSIQGLIFTSDPYYNEPLVKEYWARCCSQKWLSDLYSMLQQGNTLRYSILPALQNTSPLFSEVVRQHYLRKKDYIFARLNLWKNTGPWYACGLRYYIRRSAECVIKELERLASSQPLV